MKTLIITKLFFVLPVILFVNYLIMTLLGCATCLFGMGEDFYCGAYCTIGKILIGLTAVFFFFFILPDIKALIKTSKNAETQEK